MALLPAQPGTFQLTLSNTASLLTYQISQTSNLSSGTWTTFQLGTQGQTSFLVTNNLPQQFFRASPLTNY
jgi:hypothetical protein